MQGDILLGPSVLGRNKAFLNHIFSMESLTVLDMLATIDLLLLPFLVGLELDLASLHRMGSRALTIAMAGISLPFSLGAGSSLALRAAITCNTPRGPLIVFMGVALSITAFSVLARVLAKLKLLMTNLGHMAMSAATVNDVTAWILLALTIALSGSSSLFVSVSRSPPPRGDVEQKQWRCSAPATSLRHSSRASSTRPPGPSASPRAARALEPATAGATAVFDPGRYHKGAGRVS